MLEAVFFIQNRFINPSILPLWLSVHLPTFPFECFIFSLTPCQAVWPNGQIISSIFAHWQEWKFAQTKTVVSKCFKRLNKCSQNCQRFIFLAKIGIFSPNLVTLQSQTTFVGLVLVVVAGGKRVGLIYESSKNFQLESKCLQLQTRCLQGVRSFPLRRVLRQETNIIIKLVKTTLVIMKLVIKALVIMKLVIEMLIIIKLVIKPLVIMKLVLTTFVIIKLVKKPLVIARKNDSSYNQEKLK